MSQVKLNRPLKTVVAWMTVISLSVIGCAKERDVEHVINNQLRVKKTDLLGTYSFLKTMTRVSYPGREFGGLPAGYYLDNDKLVQLVIKENSLDIVSIDPLFQDAKDARANSTLASFPIEHVDILRKQNVDNEDTHEEEETNTRRVWNEREYIKIDVTEDNLSPFKKATVFASPSEKGVQIDRSAGAINIVVTRHLNDDTEIDVRYSLLKFENNETYSQKEYSKELQKQFGFFKSTTYQFDQYGRITTKTVKDFANRWDTSKPVTFYLSKNFPEHLIPVVKQVFENWNYGFRQSVGHDVLKLEPNSGQEMGDLRYSMITYVDDQDAAHRILGYGPSYTNPRTGEIIKADVVLFGGTLRRSLFSERVWEILLNNTPGVQTNANVVSSEASNSHAEGLVTGTLGEFDVNQLLELPMKLSQSLDQTQFLGRDTLDSYLKDFNLRESIPRIRKEIREDLENRIARVDANFMTHFAETQQAGPGVLSDEALEVQIFTPLLTHELGHTLGLRHNFLASADERHFDHDTHSSSVMDYGYLTAHEPMKLGKYDAAALQVLYGADSAKTQAVLDDNYFFCTDDGVLDPRNALCNRFDAGVSLTDVVQFQLKRYSASWIFSNLRLDREHWNVSTSEYMGRVMQYLMPLRMVFDNAHAIIKAAEAGRVDQLWYVAGQRIQAAKDSRQTQEIEVASGYSFDIESGKINLSPDKVKRTIDLQKLNQVIADAKQAQSAVIKGLFQLLLDENRPLFNSADQVHHELQVRGVIYDKIVALLLLFSRTADPAGSGGVINPYTDAPSGAVSVFLNGLLTNTLKIRHPQTQEIQNVPNFYDINIRQMALNLLVSELMVPGRSASSRELLASQQVRINRSRVANLETLNGVAQAAPIIRPLLEQALVVATNTSADEQRDERSDEADLSVAPPETGVDAKPSLTVADLLNALLQANVSPTPLLSFIPDLQSLQGPLSAEVLKKIIEGLVEAKEMQQQLARELTDDEALYQQIESLRSRAVTAQAKLFDITWDANYNPKSPDPAEARLKLEVINSQAARKQINSVFVYRLGDWHFKAPVRMANGVESAAGILMRDNHNLLDDQSRAAKLVARVSTSFLNQEMSKPEDQRNEALIKNLRAKVARANQTSNNIDEYLANEKLYLETFEQLYEEPI